MTAKERIPGETENASHPTILVVADDASVLKMLKMALEVECECKVLALSSGKGVLEATKRIMPTLIVIYSHLFDLNELKFTDQLHAIEGLASLPIILIHTSIVSSNENHKPYLIKLETPFRLEELYTAVNHCIRYP